MTHASGFDRRAVEDAAAALRTQLDLILDRAAALAATFLLPESTTRSYIILACMVLFVGFVQMFIGTCVWLLLSEIFPLSIRGFAMGIAVFVLWCTNAIISFLFPLLNSALGSTGTFGLFVAVNLASLVFVEGGWRSTDRRRELRG